MPPVDVTIGITSSHPELENGAVHRDVLPYARAVERAGATHVLLRNDRDVTDELVASLGGILVTGGVDVDPVRYGGNPLHARSQAGRYRADRDAFEIALVRAARERSIPALCVCRGLQIANVAFGGTLVEDLRERFGEAYVLEHRQTDEAGVERSDYASGHEVALASDSRLALLLGRTNLPTNSMHHQAVATLGEGLVVVGRTSDGVIEAAEAAFDHPFFIAVQWHPEELDDEPSRALFAGLAAAAARRLPESPI